MIDILSIQKEIEEKYHVHFPHLFGSSRCSDEQVGILLKMLYELDMSKEENVRAYLEQKAKFLSGKK